MFGQTSRDSSEVEVNRTPGQGSEQDNVDGLGDGMDADGFAGP